MKIITYDGGKKVVRDMTSQEVDSAPTDAETLAAWRSTAECSPAQMRLALLASGDLATVQAIADSDQSASIVWEYATVIYRKSSFINALNDGDFTDLEIDDLFRAAMAVDV